MDQILRHTDAFESPYLSKHSSQITISWSFFSISESYEPYIAVTDLFLSREITSLVFRTFLHTIPELISNRLSPSDLFTLDLSLKIIRVPAEQLMHLLSPWELFRLSELFLSFSSLDHQYVSHQKFDQIFHRYLQRTMPELNFTDEQLRR